MSVFTDIALLRPTWLLLLPALVLVAVFLRRQSVGLGDWTRVIDPAMMVALRALGRVEADSTGARGMAALITAALVVLALAGPAIERREAAAFRNLDGVVFVLDASKSATEGSDWIAMQTIARYGIAALGSRPAGLVIFAGDAYVATDLTADTRQLGITLSLVDAETVPDPGSRPHLGLALARDMLQSSGVLAGDVVLISDGAGLGPEALKRASDIAGQKARLSVIVPQTSPAAETLAAAGAGKVFNLAQIDDFAGFLGRSGRDRLEEQEYKLLFRADLGRYLLLAALIPALILFRRRLV
ncbi:vWA domain-containing protein [uncultured Roseovarius sp.]|uniref:vWA domain-containing protein n=1 Tax=uncultured Roseovarius sp. TaxID=293344 RepID=UPI00260386C8|nr:vWA domain-containing protein [uncultured Roseovarius sp.]